MSYEGYHRWLCKNGHLTVRDCYDYTPKRCPECKCKFVWDEATDQTNGWFPGCETELKLLSEVKCPTCGHTTEQRYEIPGGKNGKRVS